MSVNYEVRVLRDGVVLFSKRVDNIFGPLTDLPYVRLYDLGVVLLEIRKEFDDCKEKNEGKKEEKKEEIR